LSLFLLLSEPVSACSLEKGLPQTNIHNMGIAVMQQVQATFTRFVSVGTDLPGNSSQHLPYPEIVLNISGSLHISSLQSGGF
jgi:hypothetical protein